MLILERLAGGSHTRCLVPIPRVGTRVDRGRATTGRERVRRTRKQLYKIFSSTAVAAINVKNVAVNWMK
jgi:hypothetical protein